MSGFGVQRASKMWADNGIALPLFSDMPTPSWTARMAHFDAASFDSAWFAQAGIIRPDHIARSVPKRQAEYFFGRLCAQQALLAAGIAGAHIATGAARAPVWPPGVVGSITHNAGMAAAIVAPAAAYAGIGIDIETIPSAHGLAALTSTALSGDELDLLRALCDKAPLPLLVTAVFSAKESFFKASYADVGRYFEFDAVSVRALDLARGVIELEQNLDLCPQLRSGDRHRVLLGQLEADTVCTLYARPLSAGSIAR